MDEIVRTVSNLYYIIRDRAAIEKRMLALMEFSDGPAYYFQEKVDQNDFVKDELLELYKHLSNVKVSILNLKTLKTLKLYKL